VIKVGIAVSVAAIAETITRIFTIAPQRLNQKELKDAFAIYIKVIYA
jgi:hypothetical protein